MTVRLFHYPLPVLFVAILFLVIPILNFYGTAAIYDLRQQNISAVFSRLTTLQYILSGISLLIAYGLLAKKKFGYFLFLCFGFILVTYNVWMIVWVSIGKKIFVAGMRIQTADILWNSGITIFFLGVIFYFLRREVSAPYLSPETRGWRGQYRETHPIPVHWTNKDGETEGDTQTINVSESGILIPLTPHHFLKEGDPVNLLLKLENEVRAPISISVAGQVVRIDKEEDGSELAGIQILFQVAQKEEKLQFESFLTRVFAPRYPVRNEVRFGDKTSTSNSGILVNVSMEGLYIETDSVLNQGVLCVVKILTRSGEIQVSGVVKWSNPTAKYGKPKGFGIQIETIENKNLFRIWIWKQRFKIFHGR
ncbi:MAG: PilZ domain-containing protein [Leptospira sp.]|nr:PilZ domain-containing protein [Leptospira sp.]